MENIQVRMPYARVGMDVLKDNEPVGKVIKVVQDDNYVIATIKPYSVGEFYEILKQELNAMTILDKEQDLSKMNSRKNPYIGEDND